MDEYTKECIKWLFENDEKMLVHYVNTVCKSNINSVSSVDEAKQMILDGTIGTKKEELERLVDNGIKCKNCGKNTVTFLEMQTRSADEGASVFYSCSNCLTKWKQR
jgi:DNA-directed RNA polymerase I subunit RPA12